MRDTKGGKKKEKRLRGKNIAKRIRSGSREIVPMSELFGKIIPDKRAKINDKWLIDETATIVDRIVPIYNFKAGEEQ